MRFEKEISKEDINKLPIYKFKGTIYLIDSHKQINYCYDYLKKQSVIGFDTETKPAFRKGITNHTALLQLATDSVAFLIRLNKTGLPDKIVDILSDIGIKKVGLGIIDDLKSLKGIKNFKTNGFIDLQDIVTNYEIEVKSLRKLAAIVLNVRISKTQQLSNWEDENLTEAQQLYAATDAWACYEIYNRLNHSKKLNE